MKPTRDCTQRGRRQETNQNGENNPHTGKVTKAVFGPSGSYKSGFPEVRGWKDHPNAVSYSKLPAGRRWPKKWLRR